MLKNDENGCRAHRQEGGDDFWAEQKALGKR
jgi:hypothetical protein